PLAEEFLDRHPPVVLFELLAPGADAQEALQVIEARHDHPAERDDRDGDAADDDRLQQALRPVRLVRAAEEEARQLDQFVRPRQSAAPGPSSKTSRTFRARASGVNGFCRKGVRASISPCRTTASSV